MKKSRKAAPQGKATKATKAKPTKPSNVPLIVAGVILLVLIIGGIVWYLTSERGPYAAVVNGERITEEQLDFQYQLLPESYRSLFDKDDVLEQIIDEELIVQAATRQGITASEQDVNERVQEILAQNGISITDLQSNLEEMNITLEEFERLISRQVVIERYRNTTLAPIEPTDAALQQLYEESKAQYTVGEQVTVRHVLISNQREDAGVLAKQVYDNANDDVDFCGLVRNFTDDRGSRERCGEYTFPRGFMVPEFETASFEMEDGEVRMVQTQFGYHIIEKLNSTPETVRPYAEVRDDLRETYESTKRSEQYRELVARLRSQATIIYANGTRLLPRQTGAVVGPVDQTPEPVNETGEAPLANETPAVDETPSVNETSVLNQTPAVDEAVVNETPVDETPAVDEAPLNETPANDTLVNETIDDVPAIPEPPAVNETAPDEAPDEPAPPVAEPVDNLFACIAETSVLYGTSWNTDTQDALDIFARSGVDLPYVACDTEGNRCQGIEAYPTWVIKKRAYVGRLTLEQLRQLSDC